MKNLVLVTIAALALAACSPAADVEATPSSTPTANSNPGSGGGTLNTDDEFCVAMYEAFTNAEDTQTTTEALNTALADPELFASGDMTALNDAGRALADHAAHQGAAYFDAMTAADDDEAKAWLQFFVDFTEKVTLKMGQAAAEATSFADYGERLAAITSDPDTLVLLQSASESGSDLARYSADRCGIDNSGADLAPGTDAG